MVLNNTQLKQQMNIDMDLVAISPTTLVVPVTQIDNRDNIGFSIGLYLTATAINKENIVTERRLLGYFNSYAPDKPGRYLFEVVDELNELQSTFAESDTTLTWGLDFELEIMHEENLGKPLEVEISPVEWE